MSEAATAELLLSSVVDGIGGAALLGTYDSESGALISPSLVISPGHTHTHTHKQTLSLVASSVVVRDSVTSVG